MITGSFNHSTGVMTIASTSDNTTTPGVIITQNDYFCVERIKAGVVSLPTNALNADILIKFVSSNREYSDLPIGINVFQGKGLYNKNGKPIVIIPPHENVNIIIYNRSNTSYGFFFEMEGYYVNEDGLRSSGSQDLNKVLINTIL